jgi:metallo-beta-lactamase class B
MSLPIQKVWTAQNYHRLSGSVNRCILGKSGILERVFLMKIRFWHSPLPLVASLFLATSPVAARDNVPPSKCASCAAWNAPQQPFRIFGNTYYVGTHELSSILIASGQDLVLIDGDLPESAPQIANHIRALGFRPESIKLILNSHAHFDHAGGISWLQHLSGARVVVSPWSAQVLRHGGTARDDPQHDLAPLPITPVARVETVGDGQSLKVGDLALTAHFTPGHTQGGTSWTWQSCEQSRCLHIVYADSLTAVSADNYRFLDHPTLLEGFEQSFAVLDTLPCDILLTPHPGFSDILGRLKARDGGKPEAFIDPQACHAYAASSRTGLEKRIAQERTSSGK